MSELREGEAGCMTMCGTGEPNYRKERERLAEYYAALPDSTPYLLSLSPMGSVWYVARMLSDQSALDKPETVC